MADVDARVVLVTAPEAEIAERLVATLIEERLAACGNIVSGLRSVYRWRGGVERAEEVLMILKTRAGAVARLVSRVATLHPYEVPEILVLRVDGGLPDYLAWIQESVESGARTNENA